MQIQVHFHSLLWISGVEHTDKQLVELILQLAAIKTTVEEEYIEMA